MNIGIIKEKCKHKCELKAGRMILKSQVALWDIDKSTEKNKLICELKTNRE